MTSPEAPSPNTATNIRGCRFNIGTLRAHNSAHNWNPLLTPPSSVLSTKSGYPRWLKNAGCSGYHKPLHPSGKSGMSVPSLHLPYPKSTLLLEAAFILAQRQGPASRRKALEESHSTVTLWLWTWQKETCPLVHLTFPEGPLGQLPHGAPGDRKKPQCSFLDPDTVEEKDTQTDDSSTWWNKGSLGEAGLCGGRIRGEAGVS